MSPVILLQVISYQHLIRQIHLLTHMLPITEEADTAKITVKPPEMIMLAPDDSAKDVSVLARTIP